MATGVIRRHMVPLTQHICEQSYNVSRRKIWISQDHVWAKHVQYTAPTTFHPELDNTAFLGMDETQLYQSYIGILGGQLSWDK